jgi:hypothetical protein
VLQDEESPVWSERAYQRLLPEVAHLSEAYQRAWTYYGVFPTTVFLLTPDLVGTYQVLPDGPERCTIQRFDSAQSLRRTVSFSAATRPVGGASCCSATGMSLRMRSWNLPTPDS